MDAYRALLPDHFSDDDSNKITWKLRDHPAGAGGAVVVRNASGEIVGLNAFQPAAIANAAGAVLVGHQSMDTIVAPSARGKGLFTEMIRTFYDQSGSAFLYGFPNANSAPGFFTKLDWSPFGQVPMKLKPLRTSFVARRLGLGSLDLPLSMVRRPAVDAQPLSRFDEIHMHAWQSSLAALGDVWSIHRTPAYLNWRFVDHPTIAYDRISGLNGSYCVSRIADKHEARILYVLDVGGAAEDVAPLLRQVLSDARAGGAELALAWSDGRGDGGKALRRVGFMGFPERLRPIKLFFGCNMLSESEAAPRSAEEWLISYADSDTV